MRFKEELVKIIKGFERSPFLFIGSGMGRRYLGAHTWKELLIYAISQYDTSPEYRFNGYSSKALKELNCNPDELHKLYPLIASFIEEDFTQQYFNSTEFASKIDSITDTKDDLSLTEPFKIFVAQYFKSLSPLKDKRKEIQAFKEVSKNITGIITTNYDGFLEEEIFSHFEVFNTQKELMTRPSYVINEIYKIHGSYQDHMSLILTAKDYKNFKDNCLYLTSKLTTIFVEYPIIFLGYSLNDENIKMILSNIYRSFDQSSEINFEEKIIFINRVNSSSEQRITSRTIENLSITQIDLYDYGFLYTCFREIKPKIRAGFLRGVIKEVYELIDDPNKSTVYVKDLYNTSVKDSDLAFAIGEKIKLKDFAQKGLLGITLKDFFYDVIKDNPEYLEGEYDWIPCIRQQFPPTAYIPIYTYKITPEQIKKTGKPFKIIENGISDITHENGKLRGGFNTVYSQLDSHTNYPSINSIERKIQTPANLIKGIILCAESLDLAEVKDFIQNKISEADWYNNTDFKKLICVYDFLNSKKP